MNDPAQTRFPILAKFLSRGFIFLMSCLVGSLVIFWFKEPHDASSFNMVVQFGLPSWFGLNAVERWAVDRVKAKNGGEV